MSKLALKQRKQKNRELKNKEKRRYEARRNRRLDIAAMISIERWDEDRTPFRSLLCLDAATYRPQPLFDVSPCNSDAKGPHLISPGGHFAYRNRILPGYATLEMYQGNRKGIVVWNGDVVIPMLLDMHVGDFAGEDMSDSLPQIARAERGAVWMSLTPMEMISQRSGVQAASGTVVVGGLGMGWFLRKVCEKPEVEKVIVVEQSQDLLDWYGYDICSKQNKVADVICGDVYDQIGKHGDAKYLLDIWLNYFDVRKDERFKQAKSELGDHLWGWGES
jgi:hypothetical protein